MKKSKLFWFQILLIFLSGVPQIYVLWQGRIAGLTISFFAVNIGFFILNTWIAKEEGNTEVVIIYSGWGIGCTLSIVLALAAGLRWMPSDTLTTGICLAWATALVSYNALQKRLLLDHFTKALISGFFAVVLHAQVIHAMYRAQSSEGLSVSILIVAHIAITLRMILVRDSRPLLLAEAIREVSVIIASIVWVYYWL